VALADGTQGLAVDESIRRQSLVVGRHVIDGQTQVVQFIELGQHIRRLLQRYLVDPRLAGGLLNVLQHAIEDGPCEVGFRVRQFRLVVRAGSLGQAKQTLAFQVFDQDRPLPVLAVLHEILGQHFGQRNVFNYELLSVL
jgi:hypothetical protein